MRLRTVPGVVYTKDVRDFLIAEAMKQEHLEGRNALIKTVISLFNEVSDERDFLDPLIEKLVETEHPKESVRERLAFTVKISSFKGMTRTIHSKLKDVCVEHGMVHEYERLLVLLARHPTDEEVTKLADKASDTSSLNCLKSIAVASGLPQPVIDHVENRLLAVHNSEIPI